MDWITRVSAEQGICIARQNKNKNKNKERLRKEKEASRALTPLGEVVPGRDVVVGSDVLYPYSMQQDFLFRPAPVMYSISCIIWYAT